MLMRYLNGILLDSYINGKEKWLALSIDLLNQHDGGLSGSQAKKKLPTSLQTYATKCIIFRCFIQLMMAIFGHTVFCWC